MCSLLGMGLLSQERRPTNQPTIPKISTMLSFILSEGIFLLNIHITRDLRIKVISTGSRALQAKLLWFKFTNGSLNHIRYAGFITMFSFTVDYKRKNLLNL